MSDCTHTTKESKKVEQESGKRVHLIAAHTKEGKVRSVACFPERRKEKRKKKEKKKN